MWKSTHYSVIPLELLMKLHGLTTVTSYLVVMQAQLKLRLCLSIFVIPVPHICHSRESGNPNYGINSSGNPETPILSGSPIKAFGDDSYSKNASSLPAGRQGPRVEILPKQFFALRNIA